MKKSNKISKKILPTIPVFKNEDEEVEFWDKHDLTDFLHIFKPVKLDFSKLKPSTEKVTMRLPKILLDDIKILANRNDVPYQSLMKILLSQKVDELYYGKKSSSD